jgi:hypothetical protein
MSEFMNATELVSELDRDEIRKYAEKRFTTDVVKYQYDKYLQDVVDLKKGRGFYSL